MENNISKIISNFLLVFVAGYADTATFTSGNEVFSAHVTGNFVVFANKLVHNPQLSDYRILLTFPVFIVAVYFTGYLNSIIKNERSLYLIMGTILAISGLLANFIGKNYAIESVVNFYIVLVVVFALGIKNAINKLYGKSTFGPTTVMTGNVTKATLDFCHAFMGKEKDVDARKSFWRMLILIVGFLIGCISGALLSAQYGLVVLLIPATLILLYYSLFFSKKEIASS